MGWIFKFPALKHVNDSEFVERHRRNLAKARKWAPVFLVLAVMFVVLFILVLSLFQKLVNGIFRESHDFAWLGFCIGVSLGFAITHGLGYLVQSLMIGFNIGDINRAARLMIEYHDLLAEIAKERIGSREDA